MGSNLMPNDGNLSYKEFCVSDTTGSNRYKKLVNDPGISVQDEKIHWENGEPIVLVKYSEKAEKFPKEIEGKVNGLPSKVDKDNLELP